jgi:hypothetical protein
VKNQLARSRTRPAPAATLAAWAALFLSAAGLALRADELPPALTLNIPIPANLATPAWLGHPDSPANETLATLELPITPPDSSAALLVTVYFTESDNAFLRINWSSGTGAVMLASNFYENIGMANSRSLLIAPSTLGTGGTLVLQSNATALGVQRIKLEWLESRQDLVAPKTSAMLVTPSDGKTVPAETLDGQPAAQESGAWDGDVVTVPISTDATRIEQGVEFSVDLDKVPTTARLALKETGLPLTQHFVVWINQARAGTITPAVPGLSDGGFFTDTASATSYVGWRDGSFYLPVSLLKEGVNTLQFSTENESAAGTAQANANVNASATPLAVKGLTLQMNYATVDPAPAELPVLHFSADPAPIPVGESTINP